MAQDLDNELVIERFGPESPSLKDNISTYLIKEVTKWWKVETNSGRKLVKANVETYLMAFMNDLRIYLKDIKDTKTKSNFEQMTFKTLAEIFEYLYHNRTKNLGTLLNDPILSKLLPEKSTREEEVMLCVHLWLRVNFTPRGLKNSTWATDRSLCDTLSEMFPKQGFASLLGKVVPSSEFASSHACAYYAIEYAERVATPGQSQSSQELIPGKYLQIFANPGQYWPEEHTAAFFDALTYIQIEWTNDLQDHLQMDLKDKDDKRTRSPCLHVFHLAGFLLYSEKARAIFPAPLFQETLTTLALLMPAETFPGKVDKWFKQVVKERAKGLVPLDEAVKDQGASDSIREMNHYQHWSQRLIALHNQMKECKPRTFQQWWYDDRDNQNNQQRIAILVGVAALLSTAVFSLVQAILTGLQLRQGKQNP